MQNFTEQYYRAKDNLFARLYFDSFEPKPEGVTLSSGIISNFYIDCRKVTYSADGASLVGRIVYDMVQLYAPQVKAVGGIGYGANPIAMATALHSKRSGNPINAFAIREAKKGHGLGNVVEGPKLTPGTPVCIVEDVVTTSGSMVQAINTARDALLDIVLGVVLVDRQEGLPGKPLGMEEVKAVLSNTVVIFSKDQFFGVKDCGAEPYLYRGKES